MKMRHLFPFRNRRHRFARAGTPYFLRLRRKVARQAAYLARAGKRRRFARRRVAYRRYQRAVGAQSQKRAHSAAKRAAPFDFPGPSTSRRRLDF